MDVNQTLDALRRRPSVSGVLLADEADAVKLRTGNAVLEIPRHFVTERLEREDGVQLTLDPEAVIIVSAVVTTGRNFVVADVFGGLDPAIVANNCNCNCNCNEGNCNCNCNCSNCDCGGSGCAGGSVLPRATPGIEARRFRRMLE
jgi:hypothetical protein